MGKIAIPIVFFLDLSPPENV